MKFRCAACEQEHDLSQISLGADAPVQWRLLGEPERARSELGGEQCVIESSEGTAFFIRGCLDVPVIGTHREFTWGVWASVSEKTFVEMSEHWDDAGRVELGPYFGWLSTAIPGYPDTTYLKVVVHQRDVGQRPLMVLEDNAHPLSVHQRVGLEPEWLTRLVSSLLHEEP